MPPSSTNTSLILTGASLKGLKGRNHRFRLCLQFPAFYQSPFTKEPLSPGHRKPEVRSGSLLTEASFTKSSIDNRTEQILRLPQAKDIPPGLTAASRIVLPGGEMKCP